MSLIIAQWLGSIGLLFLFGWLLFRLGWATWDGRAKTAECEGADASGAACSGGGF